MKSVTFHPQADAEVAEAAAYYEAQSPGLGLSLLDEIQHALGQIAEYPEACQLTGRRTRRKPLWRFPYNLVYAIYPDRVRIVALAHQRRRPYYWRKRVRD